MNIDYTIDLDGFGFVRSVTNYTSLRDHRLAHRDKLSLKIRFTRSGVAQDVGTLDNDETHFTVKKLNEENEVLSDDSTITTWTKTSSGGDIYYTHDGVVDLDTVELESLIGQSATALVDTQFTWKVGSTVYRSRLLKTTIERALYPATIPPTLATDPARSYVTMLQNVDKLNRDGSGSVALESITTVGLQVPRWFSFVRTTDGRLYYYQLRAGTDAESGTNIRRPDDYDATTNAKVFDYQVAAYSGGTAWGGISGTLSDQTDLQAALDLRATTADLDSHVTNNSNPHNVDKAQVNLANVDNTSDLNKPISTATQTALDAKEETQTAASQAEAEAGTETAIRKWSPLRIAQAIDALAPTGGGGSSAWGGITGTLSDQTDLQVALNAKQPINSYLTQLSSGLGIFDGVVSYTAAGGFVASVFLTAGKGGTGQSSYNIGDLLYAGGTLSLSRLAGNTSTTKKILTQTGNGFASAAPVWDDIPGITIGTTTANGTAGRVLYTDGTNVQQYAVTGTGDVVRATSPTLVTPLLGTPTSGTLTNCTGLPAAGVVGTAAILGANEFTDAQVINVGSSFSGNIMEWKKDGTSLGFMRNDGILKSAAIWSGTFYSAIGSLWGTADGASLQVGGYIGVGGTAALWFQGTASPEGSAVAPPGSMYSRNNSGTGEFWVKTSGTGNTGWTKLTP